MVFAHVVFPILKVDGTAVRTGFGGVVAPGDAVCVGEFVALVLLPLGLVPLEVGADEAAATFAVAVADAFAPSEVVTSTCTLCDPAAACDAGKTIEWLPFGSIASKGCVCCAAPSMSNCACPGCVDAAAEFEICAENSGICPADVGVDPLGPK